MLDATASGCINHPGVEAAARCKQCGRPVCGACVVVGPTGRFCSDGCKEKHERFLQRAQDFEQKAHRPTSSLAMIRRAVLKAVAYAAILAGLGYVVVFLKVPVAAGIVRRIWQVLVSYLPF